MTVMLHMMCALVLLVGALGAHLDLDSETSSDVGQVAPLPLPDMFTYLLPRLAAHYRPQEPWSSMQDQDVYFDAANVLTDQMPEERFKRAGMSGQGPSLSIINPLDVLRQRLLLEMARRQMRESQKQVAENRKLMKTIGKRGSFLRQPQPYSANRL